MDTTKQSKKKKIKVGVIYAAQEGVTQNEELKNLYTSITEEIIKAKEENQQPIIIGDLNAVLCHTFLYCIYHSYFYFLFFLIV